MLPFPGWTLPNVFAPGGLQALVKSGLSVHEKRIVVAGTGPLLFAVASFLKSKGAQIEAVFDQAPLLRMARFATSLFNRPSMIAAAIRYRTSFSGSPFHCGWWPISAKGENSVHSVTMTNGARTKTIECDILACGFHLIPNTESQSTFGCNILNGKTCVDEWQRTSVDGVFSVGESTGLGGLDLALIEGQVAGLFAAGKNAAAKKLFPKRAALIKLAKAMDVAFAPRPELRNLVREDTIVCRCEDVRWSSLQHQPSMRSARLHTRCCMGACQGRICGSALNFLNGWQTSATRPPIFPVRLTTLLREPQPSEKANR
jgi:NADPH-dependent 2,4-dienoyl-CoA reductase/sulfur reductase-like enzyme